MILHVAMHIIHWLSHILRRETVEFIHDARPYDPERLIR